MKTDFHHTPVVCQPIAALFFIFSLLWATPCTAFAAGTATVGKTGNMSLFYGILFALSFLLLLGYCFQVKKKTVWFILLYLAVFVVNGGYLAISLANDLESALLANQIAYLGSAMLPLAMLMIIIQTCRLRCPRWFVGLLVLVSLSAFLLAASGSSLGLYYSEVSIVEINGTTQLSKVYGPLHFLYAVYLMVYFGMMLAAIAQASIRKTITSCTYAAFLASAVFGNLIIWFVEQMIHVDFEFLSVSYIVTELLLLTVHNMMQDYDRRISTIQLAQQSASEESLQVMPPDMEELFASFTQRAAGLTATERGILNYYAQGKDVSQVAELAFISIHTVRKHNANIYQKLGVGSRDELVLYLDLFRRCGRLNEILETPENPSTPSRP